MKLKELFDDEPKKWIQFRFASGRDCYRVDPCSEVAESWCLIGGMQKVGLINISPQSAYTETPEYKKILAAIKKLFPNRYKEHTISFFNDHIATTFEDIKRVLEEADI